MLGPSMRLASGGTCAFQTRVIGSSAMRAITFSRVASSALNLAPLNTTRLAQYRQSRVPSPLQSVR
jgi:hypothetical protein